MINKSRGLGRVFRGRGGLRSATTALCHRVKPIFTFIADKRPSAEGGQMRIMWREDKRRMNLRKHGRDFSLAARVLADPLAVTVFDRVENGEERWHTIGAALTGASFKIVVVVRIYPKIDNEDWIHVISLRRADSAERRNYELSDI